MAARTATDATTTATARSTRGSKTSPRFCDGHDNDCDDKIDEEFDQDHDGWTACGNLTFEPEKYDCDPRNAAVHPEAPEICDGLDNDCDENTDEGSDNALQCKEGEKCIMGGCVVPTCAVPGSGITCPDDARCINDECVKQNCSPPCSAKQFCDAQLTCQPLPQHPNGDPCTTDDDCQSGMCLDTVVLRLSVSESRRICGQACCASAECGDGETCFASGSGARSCLPKTFVSNNPPPACMESASCPSPDQVCAAGQSTVLNGNGTSGMELATSVCRSTMGFERTIGTQCTESMYCQSKLCVRGTIFGPDRCSAPCRDSRDCKVLADLATIITTPAAYCQYVDLGVYNSDFAGNYLPICLLSLFDGDVGNGVSGAPCRAGRDCADGACIGASSESMGKCAKACCSDAQCKTEQPNARCLPVARGTGRYEMRCIE